MAAAAWGCAAAAMIIRESLVPTCIVYMATQLTARATRSSIARRSRLDPALLVTCTPVDSVQGFAATARGEVIDALLPD